MSGRNFLRPRAPHGSSPEAEDGGALSVGTSAHSMSRIDLSFSHLHGCPACSLDESEMTSSQTYGSVLFSSCCLRCRRSESQGGESSVLPEPARSNCAVQRLIRRRGKASRIWHDFTFLTVKTRLLAFLLAPSLARSGISRNIIIVIISCFVRHRFGDRSNPDTNPLTNLPIFLRRVHMRTCGTPCPGPACASRRLVLDIPAQTERTPGFLPPLPNKANAITVRLQKCRQPEAMLSARWRLSSAAALPFSHTFLGPRASACGWRCKDT